MRSPHLSVLLVLSATTALAQEPAESTAERAPDRPFALMVGDEAPPLAIERWVQGEPLKGFDDHVTVVEFWATWCGPCIFGMPHLSEVQKKYADQGVRVVGVNIWDDPAHVDPFMNEPVPIHNKPGRDVMHYTVAVEKKVDPKDFNSGVMARTWMAAAGRNGIPSAFIVDGDGRIAWIGHPSNLDAPLGAIVAGEWDLPGEAKKYARRIADQAKYEHAMQALAEGRFDDAYPTLNVLVDGSMHDSVGALNSIAWTIVDPEKRPAKQDLDLALRAAERANELSDGEDANILDTLAAVYHDRGELDKALAAQRLAVEHAEGNGNAEELRSRLEQYQKEAAAAAKKTTGAAARG